MFVWFEWYIALAWLIRLAMVPVILRRQLAPGASVAWLGIIFLHPYIGLLLYAILGETRLGPHRVERHREIVAAFRSAASQRSHVSIDLPLRYEPMVRQAERISGLPVLGQNSVELLGPTPDFIDRLIADIDAATQSVHLLYYIYALDETGQRVADAVKRAAARGVKCRMLIDAVASRRFFRPHLGWSRDLQAAGVHVAAALPAHVIQRRVPRMDLRNHRKLSIIDGRVAYAGSHNITNPDYGGRRGAPWIDATGRFTGSAVCEFASVFAEDWAFETGEMLDVRIGNTNSGETGCIPIQVVPTGPTDAGATYRRVLLAAIQCAHRQLILTTPYFVPDEPTLVALMMAADRGVNVKLLLPEVSDNRFAAMAGRAHYAKLMASGVEIHLYRNGLLHAKTATVDDALAVFGSANIDVRSFNLNFELSILLYGRDATDRLKCMQNHFLADCRQLNPADWSKRPAILRYADSAASLLSPVL